MGKKEEMKAAAKAAKKDKQKTKAEKKKKKEFGVEEDIEKILKKVQTENPNISSSFTTVCGQPSPRAHSSFTLTPTGELLIFGGEYYNGQKSFCYNDLFKWNLEKSEWKKIECPISPKPRCSHQAAFYKDSLYMFGGEFSAADQFYHFKDFWKFDLKTSTWQELRPTGQPPSPRSGHRMVVWRNLLVLFGGFCDTYRETKYFNDLYFYDFQENKWLCITYSKTADIPEGRSAFNFLTTQQNSDFIFLYGGFAKTKDNGRVLQGKSFHDSWLLNMRPVMSNKTASPTWQRIRKTGNYPSIRSGTSMVAYKHLAIMFGGVYDEDPGRITMRSIFYNDVYAFDLNRRRWYAFDLKEKVAKAERKREKNKTKNGKSIIKNKESDEDSSTEGNTNGHKNTCDDLNDDYDDETYDFQENTFGYIDENGKLVRIKIIDDDQKNVLPYLPDEIIDSSNSIKDVIIPSNEEVQSEKLHRPEVLSTQEESVICEEISKLEVSSGIDALDDIKSSNRIDFNKEANREMDFSEMYSNTERRTYDTDTKKHKVSYSTKNGLEGNIEGNSENAKKRKEEKFSTIIYEKMEIKNHSKNCIAGSNNNDGLNNSIMNQASDGSSLSILKNIMQADELPLPRINPHLFVLNNKLFIYGGLLEIGKKEVTLDDCWAVNLVKREKWEKVLSGNMDQQVWIESDGEEEEDDKYGECDEEELTEEDECDDSSDEYSLLSTSDNICSEGSSDELKTTNEDTKNAKNFREILNKLKKKYDLDNTDKTPIINETLKEFFNRTQSSWMSCVDERFNDKKTRKREAFAAAEIRYSVIQKIYKKYGNQMTQDDETSVKRFK